MQNNNTITLKITPEFEGEQVLCSIGDCEQVAEYAMYDSEQFTPQCREHGLSWQCSERAQHTSIARFVMLIFEHQGTAQVLKRLPDVEYEDNDGWTDYQWLVEHEYRAERTLLMVTWQHPELEFAVTMPT